MGKKKNKYRMIIATLFILAAFSAVIFGAPPVIAADKPIELKFLSSWGTNYIYVQEYVLPFVERVNKRAAGRLKVSWVGPEAIPGFQQLKPLSTGVFDLLYSHPAYHMGEIALGISMDLIKASAKERRKAGFYDILDEGYKKVNAKVLGLVGGAGYTFQLKKPISSADFTGIKLRASPSYDPLIKALNGASVRMSMGETYSAIEKGVVDGAAGPIFNAIDWKLAEVAKYQVRPTYGEVVDWCWINLDSWNRLPKDLQALITKVSMELEEEGRNNIQSKWKDIEPKLLKQGMVIDTLPAAEGEKLIKTYYQRSWEEIVLKFSPDLGPKLKKLADKFIETHKQ